MVQETKKKEEREYTFDKISYFDNMQTQKGLFD